MPVCYFCGEDAKKGDGCDLCKQEYCKEHSKPEMHDCPRIPIKNPYEYKFGKGNELVSPDELGAAPIVSKTAKKGQHRNKIKKPIQKSAPKSLKTQDIPKKKSIKNDTPSERKYVYTDGTYFWYKKVKYPNGTDAFDPETGVEIPGTLWPKASEFTHFVIASILILLLVGSSFFTRLGIRILFEKPPNQPLWEYLEIIQTVNVIDNIAIQTGLLAIFYLTAFLTHELSHRQAAKHFNVQTKFRLFKKGVILIIIFLFLPIKMALPGAVVIVGLEKTSRETAICKIVGPMSNLIQGLILIFLSMFLPISDFWFEILVSGAVFNFSLALFNLLPFSILDGQNIRDYDRNMWLFAFLSAILLLTLSIILSV